MTKRKNKREFCMNVSKEVLLGNLTRHGRLVKKTRPGHLGRVSLKNHKRKLSQVARDVGNNQRRVVTLRYFTRRLQDRRRPLRRRAVLVRTKATTDTGTKDHRPANHYLRWINSSNCMTSNNNSNTTQVFGRQSNS